MDWYLAYDCFFSLPLVQKTKGSIGHHQWPECDLFLIWWRCSRVLGCCLFITARPLLFWLWQPLFCSRCTVFFFSFKQSQWGETNRGTFFVGTSLCKVFAQTCWIYCFSVLTSTSSSLSIKLECTLKWLTAYYLIYLKPIQNIIWFVDDFRLNEIYRHKTTFYLLLHTVALYLLKTNYILTV